MLLFLADRNDLPQSIFPVSPLPDTNPGQRNFLQHCSVKVLCILTETHQTTQTLRWPNLILFQYHTLTPAAWLSFSWGCFFCHFGWPFCFCKGPSLLPLPCGHETLSWVEEQQVLPVWSSTGPVQAKKTLHIWSLFCLSSCLSLPRTCSSYTACSKVYAGDGFDFLLIWTKPVEKQGVAMEIGFTNSDTADSPLPITHTSRNFQENHKKEDIWVFTFRDPSESLKIIWGIHTGKLSC